MIPMSDLRPFSHQDVLNAAGVSYRQADYWARLGVFGDSPVWTPRPGTSRPWSMEMVEALYALGRLSELGVAVRVFASIFRVVMARPVDPDGEALIVERDGAVRRPHSQIEFRIEAGWVVALRPLAELHIEAAA